MGNYEDSSGPNKMVSSYTCTPNEKMHKLGLNPITNKAEIENTWLVYSRQRRCQKKSKSGLTLYNTVEEEERSSTPDQPPQKLAQREFACHTLAPETNNHNGGREANTEPHQAHEAAQLWSMAKQLGVTGGDENDAIIEKIKLMEERDKTEYERWE